MIFRLFSFLTAPFSEKIAKCLTIVLTAEIEAGYIWCVDFEIKKKKIYNICTLGSKLRTAKIY